VLAAEIALRSFYEQQLKVQREPNVYRPDALAGYLPIANAVGERSVPGAYSHFKLNNQGFIGPDFSTRKAPGVFRIAVVGYSNFEGYLLDEKSNCVVQLQKLFKQHNYPNVEVINCSIGGGTRKLQQYNYVKAHIGKYQPDLVVFETDTSYFDLYINRDVYRNYSIEYATNNPKSRRVAQSIVDELYEQRLLTALYDYSYLVRAASKYYLDNIVEGIPQNWFGRCLHAYRNNKVHCNIHHVSFSQTSSRLTYRLLRELQADFLARGTKLVLVSLDGGEDGQNRLQVYHRAFNGQGLQYLPIPLGLADEAPVQFEGDVHLNEYGHTLLAQKLFKGLVKGAFVPAEADGSGAQKVSVGY
jgi:hypothetical protein